MPDPTLIWVTGLTGRLTAAPIGLGLVPTLAHACSLNYGTSLQVTGPAVGGSRAQCLGGNALLSGLCPL